MRDCGRKVLVLSGGPGREREVSLRSGAEVAAALEQAGHAVTRRDVGPGNFAALDEFREWGGHVVFPVLHGSWGEGGPLQRELDRRGIVYVGTGAEAAALCMDKERTKRVLEANGLPTPAFELVGWDEVPTLDPPVVVKPPDEGSSVGLVICRDSAEIEAARRQLHAHHSTLLIERYVAGPEITVGVLNRFAGDAMGDVDETRQSSSDALALPPIQIIPAVEFYDYQAKYESDATRYEFEIDLPRDVLEQLTRHAEAVHQMLDARHLSRVDFMIDGDQRPWILEINTMPGFTTHSLLPMAARRIGLDMPTLTDHLVQLALKAH